ncbi:protease pro-enzyme activation domain-containing protein [Tunturibacter psychrotolerans]|uniref:Protease pro-enzyme activation domain-containing protein n=1 Tax=Tunturiibacter psychrotolerans TaxID=3069686 RepID=A0AAU7ZPP6_9BACT
MKRICRVAPPLFLTVLLFCSLSAFAQRPARRLTQAIAGSARTTLTGSRTPQARRGQDLGAVAPQLSIPGITLVFKRSPAQEADLQQLLASQQNPSSPLYHQWLTPDTFATRFGMADEDLAAAETWLQSHGFHIESTTRSRDRITFSGTATQVQSAFGTDLHYYQVDGEQHFAPAADLTLPSELAAVTAAVLHISNFRPKPTIKVQTRPQPDYTTLSTQTHYLGPQDIATMYDLNALYKSGFTGTGQALAVVGQSYVDTSTSSKVSAFQSGFSKYNPINAVLVPGSGVEAVSLGDEGESEIDLEYSSGIAQSANIFLVYVGANQNYDVFDALAFAVDQNIAPVVSISYGLCESLMSATDLDAGNALFQQASAQGQTLVAASGDSGSTACAFFTSDGLPLTQQQALAVSYPADSPFITAVGGTQMAAGTFAAGSSQYWASASIFDTVSSLLSYVPETVWNEDSATIGIAAGGGGTSAHFTRPTWQSGVPGISSGAYRLLPDIALQSSIASPGYLLCSDDSSLTDPATSCVGDSQYTVAGGTCFATPIFAGLVAILNQIEHATGQGNVNPVLYSLASNPTSYAAAFHDIISGSNACVSGVTDCASPGESGYAATPGYDEATGLGSIDFGQLVKAWPSSSTASLPSTVITFDASNTSVAPGASDQTQITVGIVVPNFGAPTPSGSVTVSMDGTVAQKSLALSPDPDDSSSAANFSFVAPATSGSHLLAVTYPGDATHAPSSATLPILVGSVTATGTFTVAAANLTVANGSQGSIPISATPNAGYSGRVAWSLAATTTTGTAEVCYFISPSSSNPNAATLTIGVGSICSSTAPAERSNFRTLTSRASSRKENSSPWGNNASLVVCASLIACGSFFTRRRRLGPSLWIVIALITAASIGLSGCGGSGGGSSGGAANTTSPPGSSTYTLTLTGTDSVNTAIKASTNFTLTVN